MDKYQTVRFDRNRYSVPRACAYRAVTVKGYIDRIEVVDGGQVVPGTAAATAVTSRCSTRCTTWRRWAAAGGAGPRPVLRDWQLPESFARLRQALEARHGPTAGARHYIRVLQLLAEHPLGRVREAVEGCCAGTSCTPSGSVPRRMAGGSAGGAGPAAEVTPLCQYRAAARPGPLQPTLSQGDAMMPENTHLLLRSNLKQLRLPTMGAEFEKLAREAAADETYEQYLLRLTELEVARGRQRRRPASAPPASRWPRTSTPSTSPPCRT